MLREAPQEAIGVTPDIATLGKIVSGGLPGAALVGRKEILDLIDFRQSAANDREKVSHKGTFNATPASAAAGIAALQLVRTEGVCNKAIEYGDQLISELNTMFAAESVSWVAYGTYGGFHVFLNPQKLSTSRERIESGEYDFESFTIPNDRSLVMKVRVGFLLHGVDIQGWPGGLVSVVHKDEDRQRTVDAFRQTIPKSY